MWLFSQVWFACLVGFVVGVGLTWLWQVRPLNRRVGDLERSARLADRPAQQPNRSAEDYRPGFGNTSYDAAETAAPSGVGVSTGSGRPGLDEMFEPERPEPAHVEATRVHSVDDYVEALVQEYQGDAPAENRNWGNRNPEAVESWRPGALGSRLEATEEPQQPEPQELTSYQPVQHQPEQLTSYQPVQHQPEQLTSYQPVQHQPEPESEPEPVAQANEFEATQLQPRPFANPYGAGGEFGGRGNADEQYLEYLRSGAMDEPAQPAALEPEPQAVRDYVAQEPEPAQAYEYGEYPAQDYPEYPAESVHDEPAAERAAEVTSVLPFVEDEPAEAAHEHNQVEPERVEESPAEQTMVNQQPVTEREEEQGVPAQHDYFEPVESITSVVRPHSSGGGPIASAQPFQLDGPGRADLNSAQQGQLTPIEEGGWQPFAKPFGEEPSVEDGAQQWQDDWSDEAAPVNGAHVEHEAPQHEQDQRAQARYEQAQFEQAQFEQAQHEQAQHEQDQHGQAEPEPVSYDAAARYEAAQHEAAAQYEAAQQPDRYEYDPAGYEAPQHQAAHQATHEADEETEPAEQTGPVAAEIIEQVDQQRHQAGRQAHEVEPEAPAESTTIFSPVTEVYEEPVAEAYEEQAQAPRHQIAEQAPEPTYPAAQDDYAEDYDDEPEPASPVRSLFEPVIEPELPTGYLTPVAPPAPQNVEQAPLPQRQPTAPHPIRVRTGVAQPNRPVRAPSGSAGWQTGPFGPGSALPLPDGSAPSPQFRIKARTSSMVFHTESSPFYDRLEPQVWFASQEDAQRAGFTSWERPRTW